MEGDKSMWLAQGDFPFYCHFKVICYMSHSQFPTTCDREKLAGQRPRKMGFPVDVSKTTKARYFEGIQNQFRLP